MAESRLRWQEGITHGVPQSACSGVSDLRCRLYPRHHGDREASW